MEQSFSSASRTRSRKTKSLNDIDKLEMFKYLAGLGAEDLRETIVVNMDVWDENIEMLCAEITLVSLH